MHSSVDVDAALILSVRIHEIWPTLIFFHV